jgi:hypothetical protein
VAAITYPYTITNGATLDPDQLARNVDSAAAGESVYGELRGNLGPANFPAPFQITADLVSPGQAWTYETEGLSRSVDLHQVVYADSDIYGGNFLPLPGLMLQIDLPYTYSAVLWQWSLFASCWRGETSQDHAQNENESTGLSPAVIPAITLKAYKDGAQLAGTLREMPVTVTYDYANKDYQSYEYWTRRFCMSWLSTGLAKGTHAFSFRGYVEPHVLDNVSPNTGRVWLDNVLRSGTLIQYRQYNRLTLGIRSVSAIALL